GTSPAASCGGATTSILGSRSTDLRCRAASSHSRCRRRSRADCAAHASGSSTLASLGVRVSPPKKVGDLGSTARGHHAQLFGVRFRFLALLLAPLAPTFAQRVVGRTACNGEIVSGIDIHSHPTGATFVQNAWVAVGNFAGIHHVPTRDGVIIAYIRVEVGKRCTELDRSESER